MNPDVLEPIMTKSFGAKKKKYHKKVKDMGKIANQNPKTS